MTTASTSQQQPTILPLSYRFVHRKRCFEESLARLTPTTPDDTTIQQAKKRPTLISVFTEEELRQREHQDCDSSGSQQQSQNVDGKLFNSGLCTPCWQSLQQIYERREHCNHGLLHTLYSYRQFFIKLYSIYQERKKVKKITPKMRDSLKSVMSAYGIGYRTRPISLRTPFEEGMKDRYIIFRGWICPSVNRTLFMASMILLLGREQEAFAEAAKFYQNVILATLIFMHEALSRRAKLSTARERSAALKLDAVQDESCEHNDEFMRFLWQSNVTVAERECAEFRASQAAERVKFEQQRADHHNTPHHNYMLPELPLQTMSMLQTVVNDYKEGKLDVCATEQRFCEALYRGGRSGADYMMPHQTPVKYRAEHRIEMDSAGVNHFIATPLPPTTSTTTTPPLLTNDS